MGPHKATWNSLLQGYLEYGFAVTFEKVKRYIQPSEYNLPTKAFIAKWIPRVVAGIISFEENTFKAPFGGLVTTGADTFNASFPQAANSPGHELVGDANHVGSLVIQPLYGAIGSTITLYKCDAELYDDIEISNDKLTVMPLRFEAYNNGAITANDWKFQQDGDGSVASSTRMLEYAKIETYLKATYTTSTFIVSEPPETFLPGIPFPCIFIVEKSVDSIFQDKRIIRVRLNLNIYDYSTSDPFGIDTNLRINNIITSITAAFSSVKASVATLSVNGRVTSVTPPTKRIGNEIQKGIITLELFINET